MDKIRSFADHAKEKALPVLAEGQKAMKPFFMAASYCLICVAWVITLPFALAADFLKSVGDKFKPQA